MLWKIFPPKEGEFCPALVMTPSVLPFQALSFSSKRKVQNLAGVLGMEGAAFCK